MSTPDLLEYIQTEQPRHVIVLHHWDTDGLASAALFLNFFEKREYETAFELMRPTVNNYFLTEKEYTALEKSGAEAIIVVDFNIPPDVVARLESIFQHVFIFDHHSQTAHINKPGVQDIAYPGCSMLVNDYLMQPLSLTAVLGMVGDQEDRIMLWPGPDFYPQVEQIMKEQELTLEQLIRVTKLIDCAYIIDDERLFHQAMHLLLEHPAAVLEDVEFLQTEKMLQDHIDFLVAKKPQQIADHVVYLPIDSKMNVISEVTRAVSRARPDDIVVTDQQRGEQSSLYVRRRNASVDLGVVVDAARAQGYNAGGKPEVAGVVLLTKDITDFREKVFSLLKNS